MTLPERIQSKIIPEPNSGCWLWLGYVNHKGYGHTWNGLKVERAHRVVYRLLVGNIPDDRELDHKCRVRCCVNPAHMEAVTHQVNIDRSYKPTKTHCKHNHPLSGDNLSIDARGQRVCRECHRQRCRSHYQRSRGIA
jgi:hypothetical protein